MESKDTVGEQQTGEGRIRLAWIGHERSEKWNDRPVPLETRWGGFHWACAFKAQLWPSSNYTLPLTKSPWVWGQGTYLPEATLSFNILFWLSRTPDSLPKSKSPCSLLDLPPLGLVQSIQRSKHVTGVHTPKVKWLSCSHLQYREGMRTGLRYVDWGLHMYALWVPHDEGWSEKWTARKAGYEWEVQYQLSPTKPCSTPELQGLWEF